MWSIIVASVVDLPDPVTPVTSTRPFGILTSSLTTVGSCRSSKVLISVGMFRRTVATVPLCMKTFIRTRPSPSTPKERSSSWSRSKRSFCSSVRRL